MSNDPESSDSMWNCLVSHDGANETSYLVQAPDAVSAAAIASARHCAAEHLDGSAIDSLDVGRWAS